MRLTVGSILGMMTMPMAVLTVLAPFSALTLFVLGYKLPVAIGLTWSFLIFVVAFISSIGDGVFASYARQAVKSGKPTIGWVLSAVQSSIIPWAIVVFNFKIFGYYCSGISEYYILWWIFSYGVATGAWTLRALTSSRRKHTLVGVQAFAAHLAYGAFSFVVLILRAPETLGLLLMIFIQILPVSIGSFLALADRNALRDVQG